MQTSVKRKFIAAMVAFFVVYILFDTLLDMLLEFIHVLLEAFEFSLDILVEHIFHTDLHTTQVITFYLMLLIGALILYYLARRLPGWYQASRKNLADAFYDLKVEAMEYWRTIPVINKIKCWAVLAIGTGIVAMGLFS